jgi:hypothetical protein
VAQFRVEFVLDEATGKYLAEMYHPERQDELIVRTEALYPTQAAAVLGVVQLFKNAILQFPRAGEQPKKLRKPRKAKKAQKPTRKMSARSKKRK